MAHQDKKSSKFGFGVIVGSLIGGLTAFFFSPKSGKENREMVAHKIEELKKLLEEHEVDTKIKEIFGEATEEVRGLYFKAKDEIISRLAQLKEKIQEIDREKYREIVEGVVANVKDGVEKLSEGEKKLIKLKGKLLKDWEKLRR